MSRYEYSPQGWPDQYAFAIGWDDASVIVSAGGTPPYFHDLDNLMRNLTSRPINRSTAARIVNDHSGCKSLTVGRNSATALHI